MTEEEILIRLGRKKPDLLDPRNKNFPVRQLLPRKASKLQYRYWDNLIHLNQWDTPHCVPFAWSNWVNSGPVKHKKIITEAMAHSYYPLCQELDEIDGNNYDGSTTLGGAKAFQKLRYVGSYYWSFALETTVAAVRDLGPMVIGIDWDFNMFYPDKNGFIKTGGGFAGGHEIVIDGVSIKDKKFRLFQTWGAKDNLLTGEEEWGLGGRCWISFDEFGKLIDRKAEMCIATELK